MEPLRLGDVTRRSRPDHRRHLRAGEVRCHRDHADGADRHERQRDAVLPRIHRHPIADLGHGARRELSILHRVLHRHDPRVLGQGGQGGDLDQPPVLPGML